MKVVAILLVLFSLTTQLAKEQCKCLPASKDQQTSWGQENVIIKPDEAFKQLRGKVLAPTEDALEGVLVEVYDKPEGLLMDWKERKARKVQQRKVAACLTGPNGQFCFSKLSAGQYELRASKPNGWNATSMYVVVDPKSAISEFIVPLHLAH